LILLVICESAFLTQSLDLAKHWLPFHHERPYFCILTHPHQSEFCFPALSASSVRLSVEFKLTVRKANDSGNRYRIAMGPISQWFFIGEINLFKPCFGHWHHSCHDWCAIKLKFIA
jgi:hypothetical protein